MPFDPDHARHVLRDLARQKTGLTIAFGAGQRTAEALAVDPTAAREAIAAVVDDHPARFGQSLGNFTVQSPTDFTSKDVQRVLICSEMFERQLAQRARELFGPTVEIITSYDQHASLVSALARTQQTLQQQWHEPNDREALWLAADRLMSDLHARLGTTPEWRYGPQRQIEEFRQLRDVLAAHSNLEGAALLNAGCGRYHPLGQSLLALLAGASSAWAIDLEAPLDEVRSARAAADLVAHAFLNPASCGALRCEVFARLEPHIDLAALAQGQWRSALHAPSAIRYDTGSIMDIALAPGPFDIIISRDVFEHLHDVPAALAALHSRLAPTGLLIIWIDFSDHRRYSSPQRFSHWSNLTHAGPPTDRAEINGLRYPQYVDLFTRANFSVLQYDALDTESVPAHVRPDLAPMYRELADDDLAVCRAVAVLKRTPAGRPASAAPELQRVHQ